MKEDKKIKNKIVALSKQRRNYVYEELEKERKKRKLSNSDKSKIMKKAWKEAKIKFK
jgi:hypothetical protein